MIAGLAAGAITVLDTVDSTMDAARRRLADGAKAPFAIAARLQTKGRGRAGRAWDSTTGNLAVTFFMPFEGTYAEAARLGFAVSLGVGDTITALAPGVPIHLKWPNDVLLNGKKVCGILLENLGKGPDDCLQILIGIGINLARHPDPADSNWPPTSIAVETGSTPEFGVALQAISHSVPDRIRRENELGFEATRQDWLSLAARREQNLTARLASETITGIFKDIDPTGALVLETPSGMRKVTAGDVFFPEVAACC